MFTFGVLERINSTNLQAYLNRFANELDNESLWNDFIGALFSTLSPRLNS